MQVLLPLNLWEPYTYGLPEQLVASAQVGKRAIVQFGKSRLYTGIITEIHQRKPTEFIPKMIEEIMDDSPIIHPIQIVIIQISW